MKILRNLVILVFAAFIISSCEKSHSSPGRCGEKSQNQETETTAPADQQIQTSENTNPTESGRSSIILENGIESTAQEGAGINGDPDSEDVSGSGDDDRDGGEKRKRKR